MIDEPSPVELEYLASVKAAQKKVTGKVKREKLSPLVREVDDGVEGGGDEE